jgi:hypothetical protein
LGRRATVRTVGFVLTGECKEKNVSERMEMRDLTIDELDAVGGGALVGAVIGWVVGSVGGFVDGWNRTGTLSGAVASAAVNAQIGAGVGGAGPI